MNIIPLLLVIIFILADCLGKRKANHGITYIAITVIAMLTVIVPTAFLAGFYSLPRMAAFCMLVSYLCIRLMVEKYDYLPAMESKNHKAYAMSGYGIYYNIAMTAAIVVLTVGLLFLLVVNPLPHFNFDMIRGYIAGILWIVLVCIVFLPVGLILLFVLIYEILGLLLFNWFALAVGFVSLSLMFGLLLVTPSVLGVRAALYAGRELKWGKKNQIGFVLFIAVPLLNTITMNKLRVRIEAYYKAKADTDMQAGMEKEKEWLPEALSDGGDMQTEQPQEDQGREDTSEDTQ